MSCAVMTAFRTLLRPLPCWLLPGAACRSQQPAPCSGRRRSHVSGAARDARESSDDRPTNGGSSKLGWQPVIGLEVHAQIKTNSKLFSPSRLLFAAPPNMNISPFDLAFPGTLPLLNENCVRAAAKTALALDCTLQEKSMFQRKHYFYHDLPAGYQITQRDAPIAKNGLLQLTPYCVGRSVRIEQIQLEQDTGKSLLDASPDVTLVDMNRAGAGLVEIVMKPDLRSSAEAGAAVRKLQSTLKDIGVSDANMDEGSFRCDINVSVHKPGEALGTRTELKNIAHVKLMMDAIDAEVKRQIGLLESGNSVTLESRGYDPDAGETFRLRSKEESPEYRYMPEPDLPTLKLNVEFVEEIRAGLPEKLDDRLQRIQSQCGLSEKEVLKLMGADGALRFFEEASQGRDGQIVFNWIMHELLGRLELGCKNFEHSPVTPAQIGSVVDAIHKSKTATGKLGKQVLTVMFEQKDGALCTDVMERMGWKILGDESGVRAVCREIIEQHSDFARQIREGIASKGAMQWLVGKVMKVTSGQAEPHLLQAVMREELGLQGDGFKDKSAKKRCQKKQ